MANTPDAVNSPALLRAAITKCKRKRRDLVDAWATNVDHLRGKPFAQESDEDRVYVNTDNVFAKRKAAQLASQCPEARLKAKRGPRKAEVEALLPAFAERLNDTLREANTGDALFETAKDVINAAGVAAVLCGYEARTEQVPALGVDPQTLSPEQQAGLAQAATLDEEGAKQALQLLGIPMTTAPRTTSSRFYARRFSPSDLLWPLEFERSNFDESPWLGHSDRMREAEALIELKLTPEDIEDLVGGKARDNTNLRDDTDSDTAGEAGERLVNYDEIFYWRAKFDPNEKHLSCIWRIVFVEGREQPVIHEAWTGQKYLNSIGYVGALKLPIRVLTLDYVSDDAIPPSDSALVRPQVNEMTRSRTQLIQQRERSTPLRWHDVNRLDPLTSVNIMRGVHQASIPVKGRGDGIIGEVARANYPSENYEFDRIIMRDMTSQWGMDENQLGQFARGRRTAREAEVVQANFATLTGFQRARVAAFFCGIAEVIAGLLVLFGEDLPQPKPAAPQGPPPMPGAPPPPPPPPPLDLRQLSQLIDYSVLPDATVLLDANARADQLMETLDMVGKSGYVNPEPIVREILMLKGVNPDDVMMKPQPKPEEPPNISYRFSGVQDLTNPVVLAMLVEKGQAPSPQSLQAALKILQTAGISPMLGLPPAESVTPGGPPMGAEGGMPPGLPPADARPEWTAMPSITKRTEDS